MMKIVLMILLMIMMRVEMTNIDNDYIADYNYDAAAHNAVIDNDSMMLCL
jgi:hypothetical protein